MKAIKKIISAAIFLSVAVCNVCAQTTLLQKKYISVRNMEKEKLTQALTEIESLANPNDEQQALYAILHFEYLIRNGSTLQPESLLNNAISYFQKKKSPYLANALFLKARLLDYANQPEQAIHLYLEAEDLALKIPDHALLAYIYTDMGNLNYNQGFYVEARDKYEQAQEYYQLIGHTQYVLSTQLDIISIYYAEKNYTLALQQTQELIPQVKHDSTLYGQALNNLAHTYWHSKQYDSAMVYLHQVKSILPKKNDLHIYANYKIAMIQYKQEQYDSAQHYALKVIEQEGRVELHKACYGILANVAMKRKDEKAQWYYFVKRDSCNKVLLDIAQQTPAHEVEQQIKQEKNLAYQTKISIYGTALAMLCILAALLYLRIRTQQHKRINNKLEEANKNIHQQKEAIKQLQESKEIENQQKAEQLAELNRQLAQSIAQQQTLIDQRRKNLSIATKAIKDKIEQHETYYRRQENLSLEEAQHKAYHTQIYIHNNAKLMKWLNQQFSNLGKKLLQAHPTLTERDMQLLVLILLETPYKTTSTILNITSNSIGKTQIRLAEKLGYKNMEALRKYMEELMING